MSKDTQYTYNKFGSRSSTRVPKQSHQILKPCSNNYSSNYFHTGNSPVEYIRNINNAVEGYPKLNKLHSLKRKQIEDHAVLPYGSRVATDKIIPTLSTWINNYNIKFDVIMIGALVENQFILPILSNLPLYKLCSKPGFLFVWSTTQKIHQLTKLLNNDNFNKKFRRSEELIFLPINKDSPYYPSDGDNSLFENQQWHCWMCITGTVKRSTDQNLIHCNVDTDLQIETPKSCSSYNAVPDSMYKVAENFSNSNRRLHIVPSTVGYNKVIKLRKGWVIMGPDVLLNNFDPVKYQEELYDKSLVSYKPSYNNLSQPQFLVPQTKEIEDLRPKSPV